LNQAADQLEGHTEMRQGEVMTLVQSLLGSVPQEGHPQQIEQGGSVLDQMLSMAGSQMASQAAESPIGAFLAAQQGAAPEGESTGSPLDALLGAQEGTGEQGESGSSPLDALLGGQGAPGGLSAALDQVLGAGQPQPSEGASPSPLAGLLGGQPGQGSPSGAGGLGDLVGALMGGQAGLGQAPSAGQGSEQGGGNWLQALLPAAMAFLQAKQAGAEMPQAAGQALLAMLGGGQVNPLQSGAPRPAAGGLIAQSLLQAAMNL